MIFLCKESKGHRRHEQILTIIIVSSYVLIRWEEEFETWFKYVYCLI